MKKGSKAQRIIFNMMFRLTAYKALGLQNYPLLLDEPSEGMDEEHKIDWSTSLNRWRRESFLNCWSFRMTSGSSFKLNEATYCVVEPEGVTLPPVYNEGVIIKYAS
ncbi:hypothetical protein N5V81_13155 [Escherichia coli]|nr:hypothetical protein [Escherichia coli]